MRRRAPCRRSSAKTSQEARWRGEYVCCVEKGNKHYNGAEEAARRHVEKRLRQDTQAIHIVADLIIENENMLHQGTNRPEKSSSNEDSQAVTTFMSLTSAFHDHGMDSVIPQKLRFLDIYALLMHVSEMFTLTIPMPNSELRMIFAWETWNIES